MPEEAAARVRTLLNGYRHTQLLYVAAQLDLPGLLAQGERSDTELSAATGADRDALARLLAALADLGIVAGNGSGGYRLTEAGRLLCSDVPGSMRAAALTYGAPWWWSAYGRLEEAVRTGRTGFELAHGSPLFGWLAAHPDDAAVFDANMSAMTERDTEAIFAAGFAFGDIRSLVDVGGGSGGFAVEFLRRVPGATALVVDRPDVVAGVPQAADLAVRDRLSTAGGSFFEPLPPGGDVYVLKDILHDWDDEHARAVLRRCADAAAPSGRVLIIERALDDAEHGPSVREVDITMLAMTGGRERSLAAYVDLIEAVGLTACAVHRAGSGYVIVVAARENGERGAHDGSRAPRSG